MSITDELREFAPHLDLGKVALAGWKEALLAIADRIDAEHEAKVAYWQEASYKDGYDEGFASADDWLAQHEDAMAEHGWIRLPKDADGEYIHFGDVLDQFGTPMTVFAMSDPDPDQGDCMLELITDGISDGTWVRARKMRHHHAPTVEDVLREMADRCYADEDEPRDRDAIVAEYAAKLQLREVDA